MQAHFVTCTVGPEWRFPDRLWKQAWKQSVRNDETVKYEYHNLRDDPIHIHMHIDWLSCHAVFFLDFNKANFLVIIILDLWQPQRIFNTIPLGQLSANPSGSGGTGR